MEGETNSLKTLSPTIKLNNGMDLPLIGLGTYKLENVEETITNAIKLGYRLIDTAKLYFNEEEIGKAIKNCIDNGIVKREELFIISKLWNDDHEDPETALKESLKRLQLEYLDMYLIHWPIGKTEDGKLIKQVPLHQLWAKLEECVNNDLIKSIGVSNFNVQLLLDLLSYAKIKPVYNQVELHPLLTQKDLVEFCQNFGIVVSAYNPILRGDYAKRNTSLFQKYDLFKNEVILELVKKYNKEPAQIILNWHLKQNIVVIPKSNSQERQLQNLQSANFEMAEEDYKKIDDLNLDLRFNVSKEKDFSGGINIFA
jgi:diketogulonate reductase-like aldo/keto reductase